MAILDLVVGTNLNSKKTRIVKDIPKVKKAVNSNIRHASDQAVIRKIFLNKKTADLKLKELTKKISKKWISKKERLKILAPIGVWCQLGTMDMLFIKLEKMAPQN
ncbi:hypothetical protein BSPWISOXPB_591 [uncultured Gammaproteobacteria bacterium]|nr:hypothetical protein BSPWISOXPB_591 [uncultured Gammaproteobacteria bacterium]